MLSSRCIMILRELVNSSGSIKLKKLSRVFDISERMLRYEVDKINDYFKFDMINKKYGGILELTNSEKAIEVLSSYEKKYDITPQERVLIFLTRLAFDRKIFLKEFCSEFDISRSTGNTTLKEVKTYLKKFSIKCLFKNKDGFYLDGDEISLRQLKVYLFHKYSKNSRSIRIISEFNKIPIKKLPVNKKFIQGVSNFLGIVITDEAFRVIDDYLGIMATRVVDGFIIEDINNRNFLMETREYLGVKKNIHLLEDGYNIDFLGNLPEVLRIVDYFIGSHSYNLTRSYYKSWVAMENNINDFIDRVGRELDLDFSKDIELQKGLINHMKPAIYRVTNNITYENKGYLEIIHTYPQLFDVVSRSLGDIQDSIDGKLDKREIAYITIYFKLAIDKLKDLSIDISKKPSVVLVCELGYGTSVLLERQLKENFNIDILGITPSYLLEDFLIKKGGVDFVITTLKDLNISDEEFLKEKKIPLIKVDALLREEDIKRIASYGIDHAKEIYHLSQLLNIIKGSSKILNEESLIKDIKGYLGSSLIDDITREKRPLLDLLPRDGITLNITCETWDELVSKAYEAPLKLEYVVDDHIHEVVDLINKKGSYMVIAPGIVLLHGFKRSKETFFTVFSSKKPILFPDGKEVSMGFVMGTEDGKKHRRALNEILTLIRDSRFLDGVLNARKEDGVINLIYKIVRGE